MCQGKAIPNDQREYYFEKHMQATIYVERGEWDKAIEMYTETLKDPALKPDELADIRMARSRTYWKAKKYNLAAEDLEAARDLIENRMKDDKEKARYMYAYYAEMAYLDGLRGNYDAALKNYLNRRNYSIMNINNFDWPEEKKRESINGEMYAYHLHTAGVYEKKGDPQNAIAAYREIQKMFDRDKKLGWHARKFEIDGDVYMANVFVNYRLWKLTGDHGCLKKAQWSYPDNVTSITLQSCVGYRYYVDRKDLGMRDTPARGAQTMMQTPTSGLCCATVSCAAHTTGTLAADAATTATCTCSQNGGVCSSGGVTSATTTAATAP
jgi:tetratricopeptide (TPR) repeat protein